MFTALERSGESKKNSEELAPKTPPQAETNLIDSILALSTLKLNRQSERY